MGQRDALIENEVEFLYTNIHTHHGVSAVSEPETVFLGK